MGNTPAPNRHQIRPHMSGRHVQLQRCGVSKKVRFRDKREATRAVHRAVACRQHAESIGVWSPRQERRAYGCSDCKGWHVTSSESWGDWTQSRAGSGNRVSRRLEAVDDDVDRWQCRSTGKLSVR
jgi:hypothetical protein